MLTREDVESYLIRTGLDIEEVEEDLWVLPLGDNGARLVVSFSPPVLVLRLKVLDLPADATQAAGLYRRLLELNASDLVHGAYGREEGDVILTDTLELENLDFNEFQASIDAFQMALAAHREQLAAFQPQLRVES